MPREGDPRVVVRLSPADRAVIAAAAEEAGVAVGALVRECAVRYAASVARDVAEGGLRLRRSSARVASDSAASSEAPESEPARLDPGVARALAFRRATQR